MTKKIYFIAVMTALFLLAPATLRAASSGSCGDKVTWTLGDDGVLTIEGTGAMTDYNSMSAVPWYGQSFTKVVIKDGVTTIGSYAFCNCTALTDVTIPNSVDSIGKGVFSGCTGLTSVTIPNSVTTIGAETFVSCTGLTSVTLSNSLTSIAGGLFYDCENLANVEIPNSVKSIGKSAFYACYELASVTIPNSVDSIGKGAFAGCTGLTSVTIPNSVKSIGSSAFAYCSGLTSVTIPESITTIETGAFANCSGLTSVTFPKTLTTIGASAFTECEELTSITIPASVYGIGEEAFKDCLGLTKIETLAKNPPLCGNNAFSGVDKVKCVLYVPESSIGEYKTADEWKDFNKIEAAADESQSGKCGDDVKWTLDSDGLLTIEGTGAMTDYNNDSPFKSLSPKKVVVKDGVTTIGKYAFEGCKELTSADIPGSVTSIGERAFQECSSLTSVTLGEGVIKIDNRAFVACSALESVTIPKSVTTINDDAFGSCYKLATVTSLNPEPPTLGGWDAVKITTDGTIYVPKESVDKYKEAQYWSNYKDQIKALSDGTESGTCGDNITWTLDSDGVLTLEGTGAMTNYREDRPQWRGKVIKAIIGEGITTIGNYAFEGCPGLTSVTIPNSVTSIGEGAFAECFGLTSVTIPAAVTSIGSTAFFRCTGLTQVVSLAVTPPACGEYVFTLINFGSCELAVPEKSFDAYKAANGWKDFTNVVSGISSVSKDNNAAVSAKNGAITVTGTAGNALVEVYSTSGALVYRGTSKTVAVPSTGIYIVKAAGKTFKVNAGLR